MSIADLIALLAAYSVGSIPFALILARRSSGRDLRRVGSGNVGAANVLRVSGARAGALAALLDISKGAAGVLIAERLHVTPAAAAAAGVAAIVGHIYPVWLAFRGGKGVATACGVFMVLTPAALPPTLAVFVVVVWTTKYVSLGSVAASLALPPLAYFGGSPGPVVIAAAAAAALIVFRHRSNLNRVRAGREPRLGVRAVSAGPIER